MLLRKILTTPLLIFGRLLQARIYQERCARLDREARELRKDLREAQGALADKAHVLQELARLRDELGEAQRSAEMWETSRSAIEHNYHVVQADLDKARDEPRRLRLALIDAQMAMHQGQWLEARSEVDRVLARDSEPLGTAPGGIDLPDVPSLPGSSES